MEVFVIKRFIKRAIVFFLVFVLCFNLLFQKKEQEVKAIAIVDDMALVGLVLAGVTLTFGSYKIASSDSVQDVFNDMFGEYAMEDMREFFAAKSVDESYVAYNNLVATNPELADICDDLKKKYEFPVQSLGDGTYLTFDYDGNVISLTEGELKGHCGSIGLTYYFVDDIYSCDFTVCITGDDPVLTQDMFEKIKGCVSKVSKKVVSVTGSVVDWLKDKAKAVAVDSIAVNNTDYFYTYSQAIGNSYSSSFADMTCMFVNPYAFCASWNGIMFELRIDDSNIYYGCLTSENFEKVLELYESSGDAGVFSSYMSLNRYNFYKWLGNPYNLNGGTIKADTSKIELDMTFYIMCLVNVNGVTCIDADRKYYDISEFPRPVTDATIINNGKSGNYVIGTLQADGSITFEVIGEAYTNNYIESLATGSVGVKVSGDVTVNEKLLAQIMDNNLSVQEVNSQVASVNDSVIALDTTVSEGLSTSNSWLEKIFNYVANIPLSVFGLFSGILQDILDGILSIPGILSDILDFIISIPGNIIDLLEALLIKLFVPSEDYFSNWKNQFNNRLNDKLPYNVYVEFLEDLKDISDTRLDDITVNFYGQECTVFTFSWYYKCKDNIDSLIRGFTFIALVFFNINQVYKLIRGTSLYKLDKYIDKAS